MPWVVLVLAIAIRVVTLDGELGVEEGGVNLVI